MICFLWPEDHNRSVTIRDSSTRSPLPGPWNLRKGPTFKNLGSDPARKYWIGQGAKYFWRSWTNSDCSVRWWIGPLRYNLVTECSVRCSVSYERTVTVLFLLIILFLEVISEMSLIAMAFYFEVFGPDFVIMIIRNEARYFSSRRNSISFHYLCMKVSLFSCKPVMNSQSEKLY